MLRSKGKLSANAGKSPAVDKGDKRFLTAQVVFLDFIEGEVRVLKTRWVLGRAAEIAIFDAQDGFDEEDSG